MKKKVFGSIIVIIGFLLSPLSWWNDLIINIPISYLFAIPFAWINKSLFTPFFIIGYWLTNIGGFVLMHYGLKHLIKEDIKKDETKKEMIKLVLISLAYTILIVLLIKFKILKFPL